MVANKIVVAICSYNAEKLLPKLLNSLIDQDCPIPFSVLIVDNNSTDNTRELANTFAQNLKVPFKYVNEYKQGIAFARNRAIEESLSYKYLAFIDTDELPYKNWLKTAVRSLIDKKVDCVGGKITISLPHRPNWLSDDLLSFYGELNHSKHPFNIYDKSTPVWSGNIAYNTSIFQDRLRFDVRYNRKGKGIGGGEDEIMFQYLLQNNHTIAYEPEMEVLHLITGEKVKRLYFLKLHYLAGKNTGLYAINPAEKKILGVPRFMYMQLLMHIYQSIYLYFLDPRIFMRKAMTLTHQIGMMVGAYIANKSS
jgi:glycosyltransferase involved in cell wall biosynthesis